MKETYLYGEKFNPDGTRSWCSLAIPYTCPAKDYVNKFIRYKKTGSRLLMEKTNTCPIIITQSSITQ